MMLSQSRNTTPHRSWLYALLTALALTVACAEDASSDRIDRDRSTEEENASTDGDGDGDDAVDDGDDVDGDDGDDPEDEGDEQRADGGGSRIDGGAGRDSGASIDGGVRDGATEEGDDAGYDASDDAGKESDAAVDGSIDATLEDAALDEDASDVDASDVDASDVDASNEDASDASDEELPPWDDREDLGEGDGRDVITIGDSWMSNSLFTGNAIEGALDRLTMRPYRHYARQGVMLLSGSLVFGPAIPTQFDAALRADDDIKTVIMTGGGNDILQNPELQADCEEGGDACAAKLAEISAALESLWQRMADNGVEDVIYIGYASDAGSSAEDITNVNKNGVAELCAAAPLNCHIIDSTPLVMGDFTDGIHPTRAANDRLARAIYELMEERKIRR